MKYILTIKRKSLVKILSKIIILVKYFNHINIILFKFITKLLKYNKNYYISLLLKNKQLLYD